MEIVIDKTFKQKRNFVFSLLTDEQRSMLNIFIKKDPKIFVDYINAIYEYLTTKKTKIEVLKKHEFVTRTYFFVLTPTIEKRNKMLSRKKTNLIEFIKKHISATYLYGYDKETTVNICFNMASDAYRKMLQRTDFINQASCLLFVAGLDIPEIENILKSKSKHFHKINAFLCGAVCFPDFIEHCRVLWSNNSELQYHETSIEQIIIAMQKLLLGKSLNN